MYNTILINKIILCLNQHTSQINLFYNFLFSPVFLFLRIHSRKVAVGIFANSWISWILCSMSLIFIQSLCTINIIDKYELKTMKIA
jgi:hypothetical protein